MARTSTLYAFLLPAASVAILACTQHAVGLRAAQAAESSAPPAPSPGAHYCNMGYFTPASLARHEVLVAKFVPAVTRVDELDTGYAVTFSGEFREAGEWLDGVRGCCPTIEYSAQFAAHDGLATLRITGGPGAKEFIREEFTAILSRKA